MQEQSKQSNGDMSTTRLTTDSYWESGYTAQPNLAPLHVDGFRNFASRKLVEKIESLGLSGKRILEVGAGNSAILSYLARKHGEAADFTGLDYSPRGCELLSRRAAIERARVRVIQHDLFRPPDTLAGQFDVVYSIGVVEHFGSLSVVLTAMKEFLSSDGRMLTVIPNMAGALGTLTRRYNPSVYEKHVPHNLDSLIRGHTDAGFDVTSFGYLCSTNFGVLSSCFHEGSGKGWWSYVWLSRLTKLLWAMESRLGELPHSALFSPYLFAISRTSG